MTTAMLAHQFEKKQHRIQWPAYAQPKLDGFRCIAQVTDGGVDFRTRNDKPLHTLSHLIRPIRARFSPGSTIDGELYAGDLKLQEIASGAKRQSELSEKLELWVYDLVTDDPYRMRMAEVHETIGDGCPSGLVCVPTVAVASEAAMRSVHARNIAAGYEGTIIRNSDGEYRRGKRSPDLQKLKDAQDAEFTIVGYEAATGQASGCVVWRCETASGSGFGVTPRGTLDDRRRWFAAGDEYLGRSLTVRFSNLTPAGVPFHPVGIGIRPSE